MKISRLLLLIFVFVGCSMTNKSLSGVWVLDDKKMVDFLDASVKVNASYVVEFFPENGTAKVHFIFSDSAYVVDYRNIEGRRFLFSFNGNTREFEIKESAGRQYLHFKDSLVQGDPGLGSYDGIRLKDKKTVGEIIKELQSDYEFDMQEDSSDMGDFK